ncbi:MAG: HAD hydrolase-like protein, partial [Alphaproteobacteria bacterium]|nr:HAD hydrolase-like protein [Alphaproteobacteria bacterium]
MSAIVSRKAKASALCAGLISANPSLISNCRFTADISFSLAALMIVSAKSSPKTSFNPSNTCGKQLSSKLIPRFSPPKLNISFGLDARLSQYVKLHNKQSQQLVPHFNCILTKAASTYGQIHPPSQHPFNTKKYITVQMLYIFDLDGTLIDSAADIQSAANHMLEEVGAPPLSLDETISFIGKGSRVLVERCLNHRNIADIDAKKIDACLERFLVHYMSDLTSHTTIYPGVIEGLNAI